MQKRWFFLPVLLGVTAALLAACANPKPSPAPAPAVTATPVPVITPVPASESAGAPHVNPYDPDGVYGNHHFTLTADEQALYDQYVKTLDKSALKGVSAVSFAKIYIECGVQTQPRAEYRLFRPGSMGMTEDQYVKDSNDDVTKGNTGTRQDMADIVFPFLQDSTYVDDGNGVGHIDFTSADGVRYRMSLSTDADGQWQMENPPIAPLDDQPAASPAG